jgi:hypothetical protein
MKFVGDIQVQRRVYAGVAVNVPEWYPSRDYKVNDIVLVNGSVYVATIAHVSPLVFDASSWNDIGHTPQYIHMQPVASASWGIPHNLGRIPVVTVFDSSLNRVDGAESHVNQNTLIVEFNTPMSGVAYLS